MTICRHKIYISNGRAYFNIIGSTCHKILKTAFISIDSFDKAFTLTTTFFCGSTLESHSNAIYYNIRTTVGF